MSQANVEVVRRLSTPYDGEDLVPTVREIVERLGPDPQPDGVLAAWAADPAFQYMHPDIEWHSGVPGLTTTARGATEVASWWWDWVQAWESYVYTVSEHRDLGDWVLQVAEVRGRGRGGIPVAMRSFELYQVREGKVAVYRVFLSEQEALDAVGLEG